MNKLCKWSKIVLFIVALPIHAQDIHKAATAGNYDLIKKLLNENLLLLNVADKNAKTPLHHAAENGHLEISEYLLDKGADIEAKSTSMRTPLRYGRSSPAAITGARVDHGIASANHSCLLSDPSADHPVALPTMACQPLKPPWSLDLK